MAFKGRYVLPDPERKIPKKRSGRPPIPVEERKLTRKQELFVKAYVSKDGQITGKDAAIEAGYPERSATNRASELLSAKKPVVWRMVRFMLVSLKFDTVL
jgi:hypothetical protein